jgi:hypothetical protein
MKKFELIKLLKECMVMYENCNYIDNQVRGIFGDTTNGKWFNLLYKNFDAYTSLLSKYIGDESNFLSWFIYENDCGKKGLSASINLKKMKPIRNIHDLADLLHE